MKKTLSILLVLVLTLSLAGASMAEAFDGSVPLVTEPVTLRVLTNAGVNAAYPPPSNDLPFWQYMEKLTGVHIEWEIVATESYDEIISTRLASGKDLPDIINVGNLITATSAGRNGLMLDMSPLLKENGYYINQFLADNEYPRQLMVQSDGAMYYLCATVSPMRNQITYLYNKAWMDKIGAKIPTTTEEFEEVCKKMVGVDFNGNGKADEVILTSADYGMLDSMGTSFGLECYEGSGYFTADESGVVSAAATSDKMKNFYEFLNRLYSEKILDQQIYTSNWNTMFEAVAADRVGIVYTFSSFAPDLGNMTTKGIEEVNSEIYSVGVPLKGPDGYQYMMRRDKQAGDACCITRDCKNPELAMRWLDVLYAMPEVQETRYWGQEGLTYSVKADGTRELLIPTDGKTWTEVRDGVFGGGQIPFAHQQIDSLWLMEYDAIPSLKWYTAEDNALQPYFKSFSVPNVPMTEAEQEICDMYRTDIDTYVAEMHAKFVKGEASFDAWGDYVAALQGMGIDEMTSAYQSLFDRTR